MGLQLHQNVEYYKPFPGSNIGQMPLLIAEGRLPISVSGLMLRRLQILNQGYSEKVKASWLDHCFDTGDGIATHPSEKVKVVLDAQALKQINPQSELYIGGALVLTEKQWKELEGLVLTAKQAKKYFGNRYTEAEVNGNVVYQFLAREKGILKEYSHEMFALMKQRFNYDKAMGLFREVESVPTMRICKVRGLENMSDVSGGCNLVDSNGLLVGVRQGIVEGDSQKISLEQRLNGRATKVEKVLTFDEDCFTSEELKAHIKKI
ncbi:hypothetical protein J4468_01530 [Candidatus Woesearchaeota archaeon]|nr:hypothetical protein [Candidatus Woesearchaeota archaeon]